MTELTQRELRESQLGVLDELTDYLAANNYRYYLWAGTLLGAVRHSGYIPWDDDIDLVLPRVDFDRLCVEFSSGSSTINLFVPGGPGYPYPFAKAADRTTTLIENVGAR